VELVVVEEKVAPNSRLFESTVHPPTCPFVQG